MDQENFAVIQNNNYPESPPDLRMNGLDDLSPGNINIPAISRQARAVSNTSTRVDERLEHVFDGELFRQLRAPNHAHSTKKKKKRSIIIPMRKLLILALQRSDNTTNHSDNPLAGVTVALDTTAADTTTSEPSLTAETVQNDPSPTPETAPQDPGVAIEQNTTGMEQDLALLRDRLISSLAITETVDFEELQDELESLKTKTPVTLLTELSQCLRTKVNFVDVGHVEGPSHDPRFTVLAVVGGRPFTRFHGRNKRDCKNGAALLAWRTLVSEQVQRVEELVEQFSDSEGDRPKFLAALANLEYLRLVERHPLCFTGKRVMAAIILQRKQKKQGRDSFKVVSLSLGNRSLMTSNINLEGDAVNDCHAEILARRAFLRFLATQLQKAKSPNMENISGQRTTKTTFVNKESIFETSPTSKGKLRIKSSVTFHLYVSDAPCGDASLFTKSEELSAEDIQSPEPLFTSKQQGLLRTKIDAGEGAIPTDKGGSQSLISLQFGGRLRTMTCSDKILKWNVVGLQGALLSHFMDPVYLSSVSVGSSFIYGHVSRAVYYRLAHEEDDASTLDLPAPYKIKHCTVGDGAIKTPWNDTEKSSSLSMVWAPGDKEPELLDGTSGKLMYPPEQIKPTSPDVTDTADLTPQPVVSCVSKKALFKNFLHLREKFQDKDTQPQTYHTWKNRAADYQTAKCAFFHKMENLGYGGWLKKPEELEYFY